MADEEKRNEDRTMVYKHPGPHDIQGDGYDYKVVPAFEIPEMLKKGWYKTMPEAKENSTATKPEPPVDIKVEKKALLEKGEELHRKQIALEESYGDFEKEVLAFNKEKAAFEKAKKKLPATGKG